MPGIGIGLGLALAGSSYAERTPEAPVNVSPPAISGTARVGEILTATPGTWAGTPTPSLTYQWRRDGTNIDGATSTIYTCIEDDVGAMIDCRETATNVAGSDSELSNAVGPVVGDWTPASVPEVVAWYDFSDKSSLFQDSAGTTPVTTADQLVGRVEDKSGNGNHAIQTTSGNRPQYKEYENSPAVLIDASSETLALTTLDALTDNTGQWWAAFAVRRVAGTSGTWHTLLAKTQSSGYSTLLMIEADSGAAKVALERQPGTWNGVATNLPNTDVDLDFVIAGGFNGTQVITEVDGIGSNTGSSSGSLGTGSESPLRIGGTTYGTAFAIYEAVICDEVPSSGDRALIFEWLRRHVRPSYDVEVSFAPADAKTEFRQSEGGMLTFWDLNWTPGSAADIAAGYKIGRYQWNIRDWIASDISGTFLSTLQSRFDFCRENGIKVIPRFYYDDDGTSNPADATLYWTLRHIEQLGEVLTANADVIAWIEAGFIGWWGEWHAGTINQSTWVWSGPTNMPAPSDREAVMEALIEHFPSNRHVSFRYPWAIREWYASAPSIGDRGTAKGRIAFHNDAYLADSTDAGTYLKDGDKDYCIAMGDAGHPINVEFWPSTSARADIETVMSESASLGLTALNRYGGLQAARTYHEWSEEEYETLLATVGYRPVLVECKHSAAVTNDSLPMSVTVRNDGWARIPNERHLWVRLVGDTTHDFKLTTEDCRDWAPGEEVTWEFVAEFPSIPAGTYAVHLGAPDGSASLEDDPRYNVRFANADDGAQAWADGWMATGTSVTVS